MSFWFVLLTLVFIIGAGIMVLLILVQRPQGGGLTSAFGGASGGGTETVFGGRVGDALTWMTVVMFAIYLLLALGLNMMDHIKPATDGTPTAAAPTSEQGGEPNAGLDAVPPAEAQPASQPAATEPAPSSGGGAGATQPVSP